MVLFVNPNGNDTTGDGTEFKPYKTITKAVTMSTAANTDIYLSKGIHTMYSLLDMSSASSIISYYGQGIDTVIEIQYCYGNGSFKNKMTINKCVIRPSNGFTGDTRALSYTSDAWEIRFNYVLFTRSLNTSFPTSTMFYFHYNTYDYACNKIFIGCTFIHYAGYPIWLGACVVDRCTTTYGAINFPSITVSSEYASLYSQTYNEKYELLTNDNRTHGVYIDWSLRVMMLLENKYYTIKDDEIIEADLDIKNSCTTYDMEGIDKQKINSYCPFKLVIFETNKYKNITYPLTGDNAFLLINLSDIDYANIKLTTSHKMIVSDDLKLWNNYYDSSNHNSIYMETYDDRYIKDYVRDKAKYIKYIDKKYNYILIKLNFGETFTMLFEEIEVLYKKMDLDVNVLTGTVNKTTLVVPTNVKSVLVNKNNNTGKTIYQKDTMEVF